ncbi:MAG: PrgI family protein [Candidatus Spechtbacterales bacterium]
MAQYPVPQFIDRETRLVGPLTVRQMIIFGIDAAVLFVLWFVLNKITFIFAAIVLTSAAIILAFIKINGQPLTTIVFSLLNYFLQPRLYLWGKQEDVVQKKPKGGLFDKIVGAGTEKKTAQSYEVPEEASKEPSVSEIKDVAKLLDE